MTEANIEVPSTKEVPRPMHNGLAVEAQVAMASGSPSKNTALTPSFELEFNSSSLYRMSSGAHDGMGASGRGAGKRPESAADARQSAAGEAALLKDLGLPGNATSAQVESKMKADNQASLRKDCICPATPLRLRWMQN